MYWVVTSSLSFILDLFITGRRRLEWFYRVFTYSFLWQSERLSKHRYSSTKHSLPPSSNNSLIAERSSHFNNNSSHPRYFECRESRPMTFNYMVYVFPTRTWYFPPVRLQFAANPLALSERINYHANDADLQVLLYASVYIQGSSWGPSVTLKLFVVVHTKLYCPRVNGLLVTWNAYGLFT